MSKIPLGTKGFCYCAVCGSLPDLVKIGATTKSPAERAKQLTASTSSPTPFTIVYSKRVSDCNAAEALLHERFAEQRVNDDREFFSITVEEAMRAMDHVARLYQDFPPDSPAVMPLPWAELFNSFDQNGPQYLTEDEQAQCRELAAKLHVA